MCNSDYNSLLIVTQNHGPKIYFKIRNDNKISQKEVISDNVVSLKIPPFCCAISQRLLLTSLQGTGFYYPGLSTELKTQSTNTILIFVVIFENQYEYE